MNAVLSPISYDLWAVSMLKHLILKHRIFPPFELIFTQNWRYRIVDAVIKVVPKDNWDVPEEDIYNTCLDRFYCFIGGLQQEVVLLKNEKTYFNINRRSFKTGDHEIEFFFLSLMAKSGLLGSKEETRKTLLELNTCYAPEYHQRNVDALFE